MEISIASSHHRTAFTVHRLSEELVQTAHCDKVNSLAFPADYSDVFATCGTGYIRVWHLSTCRELLRITVPNLECLCVAFTPVSRSAGSRAARQQALLLGKTWRAVKAAPGL
jgi:WD40 repeat protein